MPQPQQRGESAQLPSIPAEPVQEGSRWRHHRPASDAVATWFSQQPLDAGMEPEHYVGGVVLIPASEKVKHRMPDGRQIDRFEDVFVPYMQVGTRIAYFRRLAEQRELIHVIEPVPVPVIEDRQSAYYNANMEVGYFWHIVTGGDQPIRYLCCTMRVALYRPEEHGRLIEGTDRPFLPVLEGRSTKQVAGGADLNQLGKAQTSAVGRALGIAGILTLGTGVASAEDMLELPGAFGSAGTPASADAAVLPGGEPAAVATQPMDPAAQAEQLRARILEMQSMMQTEAPHGWTTFVAWWNERSREEGWANLAAVPEDSLKAIISKMERCHAEALAHPPEPANAATEGEA